MQTPEDVVGSSNANGSAIAEIIPQTAAHRVDGNTQGLDAQGLDVQGLHAQGLAELLNALRTMRVGDFSVRMARDRVGIIGKIADTFNEIVATNQRMAKQLERVGQVVGRDGRTRQRVRFGLSDGAWGEMETSVNSLIDDLLWPTTEVTRAVAAVAQGDLLQTVQLDVDGRPLKGEFLRSAEIVNTMIKQLNVFTSEVTRVVREVGTEGKLGGQAQVGGVTGVWKDLTESVNSMASNLTAQVRNIADVTVAVANGDLSKKITVDVRGEILQLKEAINTMVDQLRSFASEVTRVAELALTSKYKSEFLANMSHELRTPLNSILILGQQLTDNPDGNLSGKQVEFARTIHGAGTDLLNLISDILDLSKIESGTVTVDAEEVFLSNLLDMMARPFRHEAETRQLSFEVHSDQNLGRTITTDVKRLQQVLKNLLSNAFKFTAQGGVRLNVAVSLGGWSAEHPVLSQASAVVAFEVTDTGIGIPLEKQKIIFEAFQQADASTSRKYGGTGLGLAISRELASLLGGEIHLRSSPGSGSTFTLYLPIKYAGPSAATHVAATAVSTPSPQLVGFHIAADRTIEPIPDDRMDIQAGDSILLIVEDDPHYARILIDLARDKGFKALLAMRGDDALNLAKQYRPTAVSLDVFLPDMLGWNVLSQLKQNPLTRHIPVQIVSLDEDREHGLARGAFAFVNKPTTREDIDVALSRIKEFTKPRRKRLLVVEDNSVERMSIHALLGHDDIDIVNAATGGEALSTLHDKSCDCVVLDLRLPDMSGFEVLERMRADSSLADIPVVVFTGRELSAAEDAQLHTMARGIVVKGVESPERLLNETALFLHRVITDLPAEKQHMLERLNSSDEDLVGRTVLLVDDDPRNIFALSSALERRGMKVLTATTGAEAITLVEETPALAIVLMDIMMPEMDGYQTIEKIRQDQAHRRLPIVALTAKAMKGDREKCLRAGASDYLAKPVNTEQLLSALRMWLHR